MDAAFLGPFNDVRKRGSPSAAVSARTSASCRDEVGRAIHERGNDRVTEGQDTFEALPIDADRLVEGISKIGYRPSAALMDIADNSVTAGAHHLRIDLILNSDASLSTRGGVAAFQIVDDGAGMSDEQVKNALQIGSSGDYPGNSLSKFGLGLKSAGFSLGNRIRVLSKKDGQLSQTWILDRDVIRQRGAYGAFSEPPSEEMSAHLAAFESGTVVEVTKPLPRQDSANRIRSELTARMGVTYYSFLARADDPLHIFLRYGKKEEAIEPVDFLFLEDAQYGFDPDTYDCKSPVRLLRREIESTTNPSGPKMLLEVALFPQDRMSQFAGFSQTERKRIKEYRVGRGNDGFFLYRNGRLIMWGEHLAGVGRNDINFRARLSFTDAHDELLHVDVSKQNLMIPEELEETLKTLIRVPLGQARQASELCTKLIREGVGVEGEEFNRRTEVFEEADPDEAAGRGPPPEVKRKRREKLQEVSETTDPETPETQDESGPAPAEEVAEPTEPAFERVRYSSAIVGSNVALPGYDGDYETYVRINKNHTFYQLVLNPLPPADRFRQAIEALLFAAAVAENRTLQNTADVELDVLQAIFTKYRTTLSQNLEAWLMNNQDLFG